MLKLKQTELTIQPFHCFMNFSMRKIDLKRSIYHQAASIVLIQCSSFNLCLLPLKYGVKKGSFLNTTSQITGTEGNNDDQDPDIEEQYEAADNDNNTSVEEEPPKVTYTTIDDMNMIQEFNTAKLFTNPDVCPRQTWNGD